jgi:hypothetical protein
MTPRYLSGIALLLALLLCAAPALGQASDPLVQLDSAKLTLADGKLSDAQEQLAAIDAAAAEAWVAEEVAFQRMLLSAAFLNATQFLIDELGRTHKGETAYAKWLGGERDGHSAEFQRFVQEFLDLTAGGMSLQFIRFRLPRVSEAHLQDVMLYSDPEVLAAATTNWDEGRQGLGKGLIMAQARVAVTLAAAQYYDMPNASATIEGVGRRLTAGVPIDPPLVLDWIAETSWRLSAGSPALRALATEADRRLAEQVASYPGAGWQQRIQARKATPGPYSGMGSAKTAAAAEVKPAPPAAKPKPKGKKKRRGKNR